MTKKRPPPSSTNKEDTTTTMSKDPSSPNPQRTATTSAGSFECAAAPPPPPPPVLSYNVAIEQYWRSEFDSKSTELKMDDEVTESLSSSSVVETSEKTETEMSPTAMLSPAASSKKPSLPSVDTKATSDEHTSNNINSSRENDSKAKSVSKLGPLPTTTTTTKLRTAASDALMYVLEDVLEKGQGHQAVSSSDGKKAKNDNVCYRKKENNNENNKTSYHYNNVVQENTSFKTCGNDNGESIGNSDDQYAVSTNHDTGIVSIPGAFRLDGPEANSRNVQDDYDGDHDQYSYHGNSQYGSSHGDDDHHHRRDNRIRHATNSRSVHASAAQYSENDTTDGVATVSTSDSAVHGRNHNGITGVGNLSVHSLQPSEAAHVIIEARRVDEDGDSESSKEIVYAHDVKLDNFKRRILYLIVFALSLGATLTVAFVTIKARNQRNANQNDNDHACTFTDEVCCEYDFDEELPLPKSIPLLCHCNQSLSYVEDDVTDIGLTLSKMFQTFVSQEMNVNQNSTDMFDPSGPLNETTVCQPYNQFYLTLATGPESELKAFDIAAVPDAIFEAAFALSELYIQMDGFSWTNNFGWLETLTICHWYVKIG